MKFSITFSFIAVALLIVCVHAMPAPMVTEEAEPDSLLEPVTTVMSNALPISVVEPTAVPIPVAIIETSMEPEVTAPPSYDTAPLKSIRVFIDGKAAQELYDGESAEIQLSSSKKVTFECITNGVDVGYVYFDINGKLEWTETKLPYVLGGNKGKIYNSWKKPIIGKEFSLSTAIWMNGRRYSIVVNIVLKK